MAEPFRRPAAVEQKILDEVQIVLADLKQLARLGELLAAHHYQRLS